jgi:hypothetical protein
MNTRRGKPNYIDAVEETARQHGRSEYCLESRSLTRREHNGAERGRDDHTPQKNQLVRRKRAPQKLHRGIVHHKSDQIRTNAIASAGGDPPGATTNVVEINAMKPLIDNEISKRTGLGAFEPALVQETWKWVALSQGYPMDKIDSQSVIDRAFAAKSKILLRGMSTPR